MAQRTPPLRRRVSSLSSLARSGLAFAPLIVAVVGGGSLLAAAGMLAARWRALESAPVAAAAAQVAPLADTVVVYGPRRFEVTRGERALHVERFEIRGRPDATYRVVIENGGPEGYGRAERGRVVLNDVELVGDADRLAGGRTVLEDVSLAELNGLLLEIDGQAGAYLVVSIQEITVPTTTIFGPVELIQDEDISGKSKKSTKSDKSKKSDKSEKSEKSDKSEKSKKTEKSKKSDKSKKGGSGSTEASWTFDVPDGVEAPYTLVINNGYADGTGRTDEAWVTLNGLTILDDDAFDTGVGSLTVEVSLQDVGNVLELAIGGRAGDRIEAFVTAVVSDDEAPVITVTSPEPGLITSDESVVVLGTVEDQAPVTVDVNGVAAQVTDGSFSATVPLALEGPNALTVTATDASGNTAAESVTVTRDNTAPVITLDAPADNLVTSVTPTPVSGSVVEANGADVVANGVPMPPDASGAFSGTLPLTPGSNVITVVATDPANNQGVEVRTVVLDDTAPELTVDEPTDGTITADETVVLSGSVVDATAVTVEANGVALPVDGAGAFSGSVPLADGPNTITVTATDEAGLQTTASRTVTRDSSDPVLTIDAPADGTVVGVEEVAVSGTVTDETTVTVSANGVALPVDGSGAFSGTVPLVEGPNTVTVTATDEAGNDSEVSQSVIVDLTDPELTVNDPNDGAFTSAETVRVAGTIVDATAVTVDANGVALPVDGDGAFAGHVPLAEGLNTITITATDEAGNESTDIRTVTRDSFNPVLDVATPEDGSSTRENAARVSGTVTDATAVTVDANGVPLPVDGAGLFNGSVPLSEGANVITVTAIDAARNSVQAVRIVTLDTTAPELTVSAPEDGSETTEETVTVSGTVFDLDLASLTVNGLPVTPDGAGAFSTVVTLVDGANSISVVATDGAGNSTAVALTVTKGDALPPDPEAVAPPINPTVVTNMASATEFLYTGPNPIQTGVAPGTIVPRLVAVLRGRVLDRAGEPLGGVLVTVPRHPEFGETLTRADGEYDLAVNGGTTLVLSFSAEGYFPVQRRVEVPWQNYSVLEDVILVAPDPVVTSIDFTDPVEVARGSVVTDDTGTRQATILFKQGTEATMVMPDGTTSTLPSISVRATEYTVGPDGPKAMPAPLPVATAYTYAVELSVDEAVAAGAERVEFNQPQPVYVENFLDFQVGHAMPQAYYDRSQEQWIGLEDGIILQVVGVTAGVAELDTDGDGVAETPTELESSLGIDADELTTLGGLYAPGQSLWRMEVSHFSPYDFNVGGMRRLACELLGACPPVMGGLMLGLGLANAFEEFFGDCDGQAGSFVICQNQTLGESLPIAGTPFSLDYASNHMPGWAAERRLTIPLRMPDFLPELVFVEVEVAGREFTDTLEAVDQDYEFEWDGYDAYDRLLLGRHPATVRVAYVYPSFLFTRAAGTGSGWADPPPPGTIYREGKHLTPLWSQPVTTMIGQPAAATVSGSELQFGGWSLNAHHIYDPVAGALYMGNGQRFSHVDEGRFIYRYAGNGAWDPSGDLTEGLPRLESPLPQISSMIVDPDGSLLFGTFAGRIHRIDAETGIISLFAGGGARQDEEGLLATEANLPRPSGMAWGPDGSLYMVSDQGWAGRISPDGRVYTVAGAPFGTVGRRGYSGDGGPAVSVNTHMNRPHGIGVTSDGQVYISDTGNGAIRRIDSEGNISTVVSNIYRLYDLAVTPEDEVVYTWANRASRLAPDGTNELFAGGGSLDQDGLPATDQRLFYTFDIEVGPDGTAYISDAIDFGGKSVIKAVQPNGIMTTLAGSPGTPEDLLSVVGDGGPALKAQFRHHRKMAVATDGDLYLNVANTNYIRVIPKKSPRFDGGDISVPSPHGSLLYRFDAQGKHLETYEASTAVRVYAFEYDADGFLTGVVDRDGLRTTMARDGAGSITITGPYGHTTTLTEDAAGYLKRFAGPEGQVHEFTYTQDGLLTAQAGPIGTTSRYFYDADGRVIQTNDQSGAVRTWRRAQAGPVFSVTRSTPLGRNTRYTVRRSSDGFHSTERTDPNGLDEVTTRRPDGSAEVLMADGTVVTSTDVSSMQLNVSMLRTDTTAVTLPSGLTSTVVTTVERTVDSPGDPLSVSSLKTALRHTGSAEAWELSYDARTALVSLRSPEGRAVEASLDADGRASSVRAGADAPVTFTRDEQGRLTQVRQGGRTYGLAYGGNGLLATATDPLGRTRRLFYDAADRPTHDVLPDGREITFGYDTRGNLTSVTPAGRDAHTYVYGPTSLLTEYRPPGVDTSDPATRFSYDLDRALTGVARPDGVTVSMAYDAAGRVERLTFPAGLVEFGYDAATGNLRGVNGPYGGALAFGYDGPLPMQVQWSGEVSGVVGLVYDDAFRPSQVTVNGADPVSYSYDEDNLLLQVGALTATRDAASGRLTGTTLGGVATTQAYTAFGETSGHAAAYGGASLLEASYVRDALGRIESKVEVVGGVTKAFGYIYDSAGRLTEVTEDGVAVETYAYDSNGNRTSFTGPGGSVAATYDAQDRLLTYGSNTYAYTAAGELVSKTAGTQTTTYAYDPLGNLLSVDLPDGTSITYVVDGLGRRIGRRVNGAPDRAWLYQDALNPIAELDASGAVVSRFVYGTRRNVPDFMVRGGVTYRVVADERGSVRLVVDVSTGAVVHELVYDAWGRVLVDTNPGFQPFGYAGGLYDPATDLLRFGARDYDAEVGRWTVKDPLGLAGGVNVYAYVEGDPVNLVDPYGLCPDEDDPDEAGYCRNWPLGMLLCLTLGFSNMAEFTESLGRGGPAPIQDLADDMAGSGIPEHGRGSGSNDALNKMNKGRGPARYQNQPASNPGGIRGSQTAARGLNAGRGALGNFFRGAIGLGSSMWTGLMLFNEQQMWDAIYYNPRGTSSPRPIA